MKLKKKIRRIAQIILAALILAGIGTLLGFVDYEQDGTLCRKLTIHVSYADSSVLITSRDLDSLITATYGSIRGKAFWQINTALLERTVSGHPYIRNAHVYETNAGEVLIEAEQRRPIIRIINCNNTSFFLDDEGKVIPYSYAYPVLLPVATGNIPDLRQIRSGDEGQDHRSRPANTSLLEDLHRMGIYISSHPFFSAQIEQIFVTPSGEYELIPKVGNHVILLGDASSIPEKMERLLIFYREGLNKIGWNTYNMINLKYTNQVIAQKQPKYEK